MFTGLIEEVGSIQAVEESGGGSRITVAAREVLSDARLGDSIAIDGACTTVVEKTNSSFTIEASPETLSKTMFSSYKPGKRVNLERPLTPVSRIGGHYVTGHVDGLATIISRYPEGNSWIYRFRCDSPDLAELMIPKGSVTVLGISLTVNEVDGMEFGVAIIPHTLTNTNLDDYNKGDKVNIETDLLGKYVRKLMPVKGRGMDEPPYMDALTLSAGKGKVHTGNWFNFDF